MTLGSDNRLWLADQRHKRSVRSTPSRKRSARATRSCRGIHQTIRPGNLVRGVDNRLWIVTFDDTGNIYAMKLDGTLQKIDSRVPSHVDYVNRLTPARTAGCGASAGDSMRVFTPAGALTVYPLPGARTDNDCPRSPSVPTATCGTSATTRSAR